MILVTGGDGYIGSHCVIALMEAGYDVAVFDNHSTGHRDTSDVFRTLDAKGRFIGSFEGDLLDRKSVV